MKLPSVQALWEENRQFLLITGAGLVTFLILNAFFVSGARSEADELNRRIRDLEADVGDVYGEVRNRYHLERRRLDDYQAVEQSLRKEYCIQPPAQLPAEVVRNPEIHYSGIINKIWRDLNSLRSERSLDVDLPPKTSTKDLGVHPEDDRLLHQSHHVNLEVIRRALRVMVDSGLESISSPRIHGDEVLEIVDNPEHQIVYLRVTFQARGPFSAFAEVLRRCQQVDENGLLQAFVMELTSKGSGDSESLRGVIDFTAFFTERKPGEAAAELPAEGQRQSKPRRR